MASFYSYGAVHILCWCYPVLLLLWSQYVKLSSVFSRRLMSFSECTARSLFQLCHVVSNYTVKRLWSSDELSHVLLSVEKAICCLFVTCCKSCVIFCVLICCEQKASGCLKNRSDKWSLVSAPIISFLQVCIYVTITRFFTVFLPRPKELPMVSPQLFHVGECYCSVLTESAWKLKAWWVLHPGIMFFHKDA